MIPVVAGLLVLTGLFCSVTAIRLRDQRKVSDLRAVLELDALDARTRDADEVSSLLARSGVAAERALAGTSVLRKVRDLLDRSDWTVSAGEVFAISLATAAGGALVGALLHPLLLIPMAVIGLVAPCALVKRAVEKRRRSFEEQFPGVLDLLAASLESGASLSQALELVVAEADEPAAGEFARVLAATRLGVGLVDALHGMSARLGSRDLALTVAAVAVQQRTGGRLAEVLGVVAETMRGRAELRRELRALVAEGKLSGYVLGGLPFVLAAILTLTNPEYLAPLFTTTIGLVMVAGTAVLMSIAFVVMARIVKVEI